MSSPKPPRAERGACPLCGAPAAPEYRPFCGRGCRDRDLLKWLGDGYRLPGRAAPPDALENAGDGLDNGD